MAYPACLETHGAPHRIPSVVTPQDCRNLFLFESQLPNIPLDEIVAYEVVALLTRIDRVVISGVLVPIQWEQVADGSYVCSPV